MVSRNRFPVAAIASALLLFACVSAATAAKPEVTFKANAISPERDIQSLTFKFYLDKVTELTDGRVQFRYFWSGSLVPIMETFEGVRDGLADISTQALSYASGHIPDVAVLEVPFAWPVDAANMTAFHNEINPILDEIMQDNGQKLLMSNPALMADPISCRSGFLGGPKAWEGKLFRTAGRWQAKTIESWGGKPVVIPLGDLYSALSRGTVDCTLLIYNLLDSFKLNEVAPYITRADHSVQYTAFTMNIGQWNKLSDQNKKAFGQAAKAAWEYGVKLRDERTLSTLQNLADRGAKFCVPSREEMARLRSATDRVWADIRESVGDRGQKIMEIAKKYQDKVTVTPTSGPGGPCT